ncbi:DUF4097 family beta strand repeat-containing protein [Paenibacillus chibensis]|uniref:DUF4097 family beta strand repeat-containing protein n=1 Tax=Paenibacillus chibensis TaxID=59846 RepID=UPI000FDC7C6A|nr:DUF4097 family beta strand repeat-containing protein [Paenibacillus chibensis]MEC0370910.1 DUF4097 family beta strand repeat-containing protein [Paenibacillus chibensis]
MHNFYIKAAAAAMLSVMLLAGCDTVNDAAQKVRQDAHEVAQAAGDSVAGKVNGITDRIKSGGQHIEWTAEREVGSESALRIDHKVGSISIVPGAGQTASVKTTIWFLNEKSYRSIVENAETSLVAKNGKLEIVTNPKGDPGRDLWEWAESKYGYSEFLIDYEIQIPAAIKSFDIANDVGGITMNHLNGTYRVNNNVGTIAVEDAQLAGKSSIKSEAGSVQIGISAMEKDSSLIAKTNVGSIHAKLADTLACTLKLDSDLGIISGGSRGKTDINGGGPQITLSSSVGAISVE